MRKPLMTNLIAKYAPSAIPQPTKNTWGVSLPGAPTVTVKTSGIIPHRTISSRLIPRGKLMRGRIGAGDVSSWEPQSPQNLVPTLPLPHL